MLTSRVNSSVSDPKTYQKGSDLTKSVINCDLRYRYPVGFINNCNRDCCKFEFRVFFLNLLAAERFVYLGGVASRCVRCGGEAERFTYLHAPRNKTCEKAETRSRGKIECKRSVY